MEQFLTDLLIRTTEIPVIWTYSFLLFISWFENIFPPIPGDVLVVFAASLVAVGPMNLFTVILLSVIGGTVGFMCMYYIGRYSGPKILESQIMRWLPQESISKVTKWIDSRGYAVVAANRFLAGARTVIAFTVGMNRMSVLTVGYLALLSSTVWVTLISVIGYLVGEEWERIIAYLSRYGLLVSGLIVLYVIWKVTRTLHQIRK